MTGSTRVRVLSPGVETQSEPFPKRATSGPEPWRRAIVARVTPVRGSTLSTWSPRCDTTHSDPSPTATDVGPVAGNDDTTRFVAGSIRVTRYGVNSGTQIAWPSVATS